MKKIFVIGSNSFTGSHFVNKALDSNYNVIGISRSQEYNDVMLPYKLNNKKNNFSFYKLDLNKNLNKIVKLFDKENPEFVVNIAAQGEVRSSWLYPDHWFQTNCISIVNLTNELRKKNTIKKFLMVSTPEVYGNTINEVIENNNYYPSTPYAASKAAGDLHLITLLKKYNFPVVFTRTTNVYGIHQQLYRIIPRTIIYLKKGKKIDLHGNGKTVRSFLHVRDAVDGMLTILEKGEIGEIFHMSPIYNEISIENIVKMICGLMGYQFEKSVNRISDNFGQDENYKINSDKIKKNLKWSPKISFEDGIKETIKWIENNWTEINTLPHDYRHIK